MAFFCFSIELWLLFFEKYLYLKSQQNHLKWVRLANTDLFTVHGIQKAYNKLQIAPHAPPTTFQTLLMRTHQSGYFRFQIFSVSLIVGGGDAAVGKPAQYRSWTSKETSTTSSVLQVYDPKLIQVMFKLK